MNDMNLTDDELVRAVDNDPAATPRERELVCRLHQLLVAYRLETAAKDPNKWSGI